MAATGLAIGDGFRYAADMAIVGASNIGDAERRAWTDLAHTLINVKEFIFIN